MALYFEKRYDSRVDWVGLSDASLCYLWDYIMPKERYQAFIHSQSFPADAYTALLTVVGKVLNPSTSVKVLILKSRCIYSKCCKVQSTFSNISTLLYCFLSAFTEPCTLTRWNHLVMYWLTWRTTLLQKVSTNTCKNFSIKMQSQTIRTASIIYFFYLNISIPQKTGGPFFLPIHSLWGSCKSITTNKLQLCFQELIILLNHLASWQI